MSQPAPLSNGTRITLGTVIVCLALLLLAGGWAIPFRYESFSILYKFGLEKTALRSGKIIGITVAQLLFFQMLLAVRPKILERIFSIKRILAMHRINGMAIGLLVISHPLLIKGSESFTPYIFDKKYYPEFLGMALLTVLLALVLFAVFRNFSRFSHAAWLILHRSMATMVLLLLPAHVVFVSDTFKSGLPRQAALAIFSLNLLLIAWIWLRRMLVKLKM